MQHVWRMRYMLSTAAARTLVQAVPACRDAPEVCNFMTPILREKPRFDSLCTRELAVVRRDLGQMRGICLF